MAMQYYVIKQPVGTRQSVLCSGRSVVVSVDIAVVPVLLCTVIQRVKPKDG